MSQTVTLRLPDGVADWLKTAAKRTGRSLNDVQSDLRTLNEVNSQTGVYARLPFDLRVH